MTAVWAQDGVPEGDSVDLPLLPRFASGWQIGEPDMIVKMPEPYTLAAEGRDEYRCFVIPLQIPAGKYLRSVEYRPGNRRILPPALLTPPSPPTPPAKLPSGARQSLPNRPAPPRPAPPPP